MTSLASQLRAIGNHLIQLAETGQEGFPETAFANATELADDREPNGSSPSLEMLIAEARREYQSRRERTAHIPEQFLGEPAWDILLDLFVRQLDPAGVSVESACTGSRAPQKTALRWLAFLEEEGWLCRRFGDFDRRESGLALSPHGRRVMVAIFAGRLGGESKETRTRCEGGQTSP